VSFISCFFLILFLVTFIIRLILAQKKDRTSYLLFLLLASLVFYASYIPSYLLILLSITSIDYWAGRKIAETLNSAHKKRYLLVSIVSNLGLLGLFKYINFFMINLQIVLHWFSLDNGGNTEWNWALPLGISFFTFQSLSYTIDIYRGVIQPEKRYWRFLLFVSFFTHLVSGPIVRARELLYQFDRKRSAHLQVCFQGFYLMVKGFFLKMVVADNIASYVNKYWNDSYITGSGASSSLLLAFLFACQIYADFDGYSSIAMGSAYLLGFKLPLNFNFPYIARSFKDFWSRWHITLSHWMRDYLYVSLGGNRGTKIRTYFNILLTFLLAGLWHGAANTFLIWGAIHGLALVMERIIGLEKKENRVYGLGFLWFVTVQVIVVIAWIFFRAENVSQALVLMGNLFSGHWGAEQGLKLLPALAFTLPVAALHLRGWLKEMGWISAPLYFEQGFWCALMLYGIFSLYGDSSAFLYFRF
jgi:alginate O-acetyltransferase complex protein AlgI